MFGWLWKKLGGPAPTPEELEAELVDLEDELRPWIRDVTRLRPSPERGGEVAVGSLTGTGPYAEEGERWPVCAACGNPLDFVAQIDLRECPARPPCPFDLVTFFYCWRCCPWGDDAPAGGWIARTYRDPSPERAVTIRPGEGAEPVTKPCRLVPEAARVLPGWDELYFVAPELAERLDGRGDAPDILELLEERLLGRPFVEGEATGVGGYPAWIQGDEAPRSERGDRFELLFQLDSEPLPGWMWGDAGILYLFFDPRDPADLRILLQCH